MSDLRERLQELADAAARHGRTPGPEAALRQGRRRRLLLAGGTAAGLVLVLFASLLGSDRLASRPAPLAPPPTSPPATTSAPATLPPETIPPETGPPDVSISPDPGVVERPRGSPSGKYGEQMVRDVASEVARCEGGDPDGPKVLVAWGRAHGRTWLIVAKPPRPGEDWLCWSDGLFEASGAGGIGNHGAIRGLPPLQASGSHNLRSGNQYWGHIIGTVTKEAARVRVVFDSGIPPLDLAPIQAGGRFPVNFYSGFYRQPAKEKRPATWQVVRVEAYDQAGRKVAECQAAGGPGHSC
jgi:hypothetical protein